MKRRTVSQLPSDSGACRFLLLPFLDLSGIPVIDKSQAEPKSLGSNPQSNGEPVILALLLWWRRH